ncbi:PH domain-containing protein [Micromonospora sp. NPDC000207]|uniref:PH domain-containing protein n=1 Tax=Micromonospora sp. NPDC000207 TaxID=3154246 RepID=UPI00331C0845
MSRFDTVHFRHSQAMVAAAGVATIGALPLACAHWYLSPVLLVPLAVVLWGWRAGTHADARELRLQGLVGRRRIAWDRVAELFPDQRGRGAVRLDDGTVFALPAVRGVDLPRLVAVTDPPTAEEETPAAERSDPAPDEGTDGKPPAQ